MMKTQNEDKTKAGSMLVLNRLLEKKIEAVGCRSLLSE
jgi:hypothetical protein